MINNSNPVSQIRYFLGSEKDTRALLADAMQNMINSSLHLIIITEKYLLKQNSYLDKPIKNQEKKMLQNRYCSNVVKCITSRAHCLKWNTPVRVEYNHLITLCICLGKIDILAVVCPNCPVAFSSALLCTLQETCTSDLTLQKDNTTIYFIGIFETMMFLSSQQPSDKN